MSKDIEWSLDQQKVYSKVLEYSLKLCCKKRYSVKKFREKLEKYFARKKFWVKYESEGINEKEEITNVIISKIISRLIELKYLDDDNFIKCYVSDRSRFRPRGEFLLRKELFLKGISFEDLDQYFEKSDFDELEAAYVCYQKYKRKLNKVDKKDQKQKLFQYLASKGFKIDIIYKILEKC